MTPRTVLAATLFTWGLGLPVAGAQTAQTATPPASPAPPTADWETFGAQLERIADLLERHLEGRKLDLLTRRLEVGVARMAPLEEELARAKAVLAERESERVHLEDRLRQITDQIADGTIEVPQEQIDTFSADLERRLVRNAAALRDAERLVAELEGELARREREIDDWQAYLDRELTGL